MHRIPISIYLKLWWLVYLKRMSEVGGGESNREIVSCRAVRACVRAVWMPSENRMKFYARPFPFSLLPQAMFPFPLWDLVSPGGSRWVRVKSKWNHSEIEVKSKRSWVKSKWNHSETEVKSKWTLSEITVISKWNQNDIGWHLSEITVKSKWNRSDI